MTLGIVVLGPRFALAVTDRRVGFGTQVELHRPGLPPLSISAPRGVYYDGATKVHVSTCGDSLVAFAGTANFHATHLDAGKGLDVFARDDHLARALSALTRYSDVPSIAAEAQMTSESCLHVFRSDGRFLLTIMHGGPQVFSRHRTQNALESQLRMALIGSGAPVLQALLSAPALAVEWNSLSTKATTVTAQEVKSFLFRCAAAVAAVQSDVGGVIDAWLLEEGPWQKVS